MPKTLIQDIILLIIVLAGIVSFFYNPIGGDAIKYLQILMGGIVGYYTGIKTIPLSSSRRK